MVISTALMSARMQQRNTECGAEIGGTGHQLLEDNCFALEMAVLHILHGQWLQTWLIRTQMNFNALFHFADSVCLLLTM